MTLSLADLAHKVDNQTLALDAPRRVARDLIRAKVADARSHAANALTERAKGTPDGRPTIALVRRSRSYAAAVNRLSELASSLVVDVADWREAAYRESFAWWADHIPESTRRPGNIQPAAAAVSWCRGMALHGTALATEVNAATNSATRRLLATLSQSASRAIDGKAGVDLLKGWELRTVASLTAVADHLLSDSLAMVDRKAGRDVCRPDLLEDDPTLPR